MATPSKAAWTYAAKLKDPRWQKRRLQVLDQSDWSCQDCGCKDSTLHVHHKRYVKGREPWEYGDRELEVLCETCHKEAHEGLTLISAAVAQYPSFELSALASLLAGYGLYYGFTDPDALPASAVLDLSAGAIAGELTKLGGPTMELLASAIRDLGVEEFSSIVIDAAKSKKLKVA